MDMGKNYPSKRILINAITLDRANIVPLLLKVRSWQKKGANVTFLGNKTFKSNIESASIIYEYSFIEFKHTKKIGGKVHFIFEGLRRNILALFYIKKIKGKFDVIYSVSSVLDLVIPPFIYKKINSEIKWVTVLDNIVPLNDPGNKLTRFLAWLFFKISLILIKKANKIFVISENLEKFMLKNGFKRSQIVLTTNGVENELIEKAKENKKYNADALFVGRINETKGIFDMLKVLGIVKNKYPSFQLAIMGDGDEYTKEKFKNKIIEYGLKENIQFLGYKIGQEKFDIIKSAKCFWFLSVSESFGIALLEAVCSGKPAFVYDLEPFKKIYKNNEVYSFNKNDYQSVANKVIDIFDRNDLDNETGKLLLGKYSWKNIAEIEFNSLMN